MPPLQIPYSHTLADSFSLFALFSTFASFVFNSLRTLFAKHRGWGWLPSCRSRVTSHESQITSAARLCFPGRTNCFSRNPFFENHLRSRGCGLSDLLPFSAIPVPVDGPAA